MPFVFFIAQRYLLSKKSTNAINVISAISVVGVLVASAALVVVLSVFNGFHDMVASFQTNFDPQLKIIPTAGKTMVSDAPELVSVREMPEIAVATECMEDLVIVAYKGRQTMFTLKGVDDSFAELTHISDCLYGSDEFCLHAGGLEYGIFGSAGIQALGSKARAMDYIKVYAAAREGQYDLSSADESFVVDSLLLPACLFSVGQQRYDRNVVLAPIAFARRLFFTQGEMTSLELRLATGVDLSATKKVIAQRLGRDYAVLDRFEQQADTYKIMQIEKVIAYLFLVFILVVACFNIISSISMLIIDKRDDTATLRNIGANDRQIAQIFFLEGAMITLLGAVLGVIIGLLLCFLQQQYGFVSMGSADMYVVQAYPVSVHYSDVAIILATVIAIGSLAVAYPVTALTRTIRQQK